MTARSESCFDIAPYRLSGTVYGVLTLVAPGQAVRVDTNVGGAEVGAALGIVIGRTAVPFPAKTRSRMSPATSSSATSAFCMRPIFARGSAFALVMPRDTDQEGKCESSI